MLALSLAVFLSACAPKPTSPNAKQVTINNALLEKHYSFVPRDPYLKSQNFVYEMFLEPKGAYMLDNEIVVKTFLLAHNSTRIILIGSPALIQKYRHYFLQNGVSAQIELQPIDNEMYQTGIQAIFFNKKEMK